MPHAAKQLNDALLKRVSFEQFLADLSAEFVNVPADRVDAAVQDGLRRLVEFLDVDRSSLARLTPEGGILVLKCYAVPGVPATSQGVFGHGWAWYLGEIAAGRVVRIFNTDRLPSEAAAERDFALGIGLTSHLGIPVNVGGMPMCGLGMSTFGRERDFTDEMIPRLRLIGEVFANALARRDADHNLRRMQAELSHVTRVSTVGQLAASIAHEINQPLCAIVSNAQAALRLMNAPKADLEEVRAALTEIVADGKRAGHVVSRSHGLLKRRETELGRLPVNDLVRDVCSMVHSDALIRRVHLTCELGADLPDVAGDKVQLQQVLLNLIVNGMDALGEGPPDGIRRVIVRTGTSDVGVRVTVSDTGAGLSPEVAARMFEPFFTTKAHGLGMGLAINRTIIEAHRGRLSAAPNPAGGASVWFELPPADVGTVRAPQPTLMPV